MKTPKIHKTPAIYTTYDIGRMTGTDPTTVHKWIDKGLMRGYRTPGGHRRVRAEDLRTFLLAHQMPIPKELGGPDSLRVLLVDEDAQAMKALSKALKKQRPNWDVLVLQSGIEALLQLKSIAPDALVFNMTQQEVDGVALCQQIRAVQETAGIRTLTMAGRYTAETERKLREAGASACLRKPIAAPDLIAAVEVAVGLRPAENAV